MVKTLDKDVLLKTAVSESGHNEKKSELFDLLRRDHERFRELFQRIEKSSSKQVAARQELFTQLEQDLLAHMEAEERFFYTALEQHDESRPKVLESFEEHQVARMLIGAFNSLAVDDERWPAKLRVLSATVRRHLEEEEQQLFDLAQRVLSREQFQGIVAKVQELRRELKGLRETAGRG
jgi:hemerythrin-like domain-containing protein